MPKNNLETIRHSYSHLLAAAVLSFYPDAKLGIGPAIENGFYYDFLTKEPLTIDDLAKLEKKMKQIIDEGHKFEKKDLKVSEAVELLAAEKQNFKIELVEDLRSAGNKKVSFYKVGKFNDLCAGPHVGSTRELNPEAFKLVSVAGAYWRGSEKNPMLTRIYGLAFESKKELDAYLLMREEAERRDHRKLGAAMELFSFHDEGPGFVFWHPKGMLLRDAIVAWWKKEHQLADYSEVSTPIILKEDLWHQSGHWDNYKNNMYFTEIDEQKYAVKPMNCPGGILIYKNKIHSYRELPMRLAELGLVHRHELSGVLHGLFRVRSFTQDDAHIYCRPDQVKKELENVIKLTEKMYKKLGFKDYHVELSTRPEKSIGSDAMWKQAEKIMKEVAKEMKLSLKVNPGDGAFYGPKFDFHLKDSIGRGWQCGTIQLDFSMPERFDLSYIDEKGQKQRPVMIHRTILGSLERFIGVLLEDCAGILPWEFAPTQVIIATVGPTAVSYAKEISKKLMEMGVRVELDTSSETVGKKVRNAEVKKVPQIIVIGEKEKTESTISLRTVGNDKLQSLSLVQYLKDVVKKNN